MLVISTISFKPAKFVWCLLLHFPEAKAVVVGPTDIYVKTGSEVILTCIVSQGPHELGTIYWYRGKCTYIIFIETRGNEVVMKQIFYEIAHVYLSIRFDYARCTSWFSIERHRIFTSNNCWHQMDRCPTFKVRNAIRWPLLRILLLNSPKLFTLDASTTIYPLACLQ